jgi:hypothetical protein
MEKIKYQKCLGACIKHTQSFYSYNFPSAYFKEKLISFQLFYVEKCTNYLQIWKDNAYILNVNIAILHDPTLHKGLLYPFKNTYMGLLEEYRKDHLLTVISTIWKLEVPDKTSDSKA